MLYKILLIVHICSVISWMAGLFYLPRLFVYHTKVIDEHKGHLLFSTMERKLFKIIILPASFFSFVTGLCLGHLGMCYMSFWFQLKMFFIVGMFLFQYWCLNTMILFQKKSCVRPHYYYRVMNEIPTVLMILIVIAVILKPYSCYFS